MSDLPAEYNANEVEPKWISCWDEKAVFHANPESKKPPFCVMMPPPNVTGTLHMGHALTNTLSDIMTRWKKMSGFETLYMPGTDHAGIATQTVVERNLLKTCGKHRLDFSREEFLRHTWEWKEKSQSTIINQVRAIGCACDWKRLRFSMDETCSQAVRHMFKKLFDSGFIYRGYYLVNWDPVSGTALADDEVEYEELQKSLWTIRYPLVGEETSVLIATTRPETMLGDTAVAVHPHDERYRHLIGKEILHPITGRHLPIVADEFVDQAFGTGVVKITPAHDPVDYQLALRRNLPMINILTTEGRINEHGLQFAGMTVSEAREAVVASLQKDGFLVRIEPYLTRVGVSYRSKAVIEPMLSLQWFVRLSAFKDTLKEMVTNGHVQIIPQQWKSTYFSWIDNLRDWCISRQLWWGHRIPVWYNKENPEIFICYEGEGEPDEVKKDPALWEQDSDVLDTWFSSAMWPFSTLGWPDKTPLLDRFYPNTTLITGHDILFFWVARMMMMGHFAFGKAPFRETFLHGLIYGKSYWRDQPGGGIAYVSPEEKKAYDLGQTPIPADVKSKWEKMSKSKGNVLDPIQIIKEYGADAMRLTLASATPEASIIELDRRRIEEFRHFINKLWNGARFVLTKLAGDPPLTGAELSHITLHNLSLEDRWILSRLSQTAQKVHESLSGYGFDKAVSSLYQFFWDEFCAYYIEIAKPSLSHSASPVMRTTKQAVILLVLLETIQLLHPFAPFITEELFSIIKRQFAGFDPENCSSTRLKRAFSALSKTLICETTFPTAEQEEIQPSVEDAFSRLQAVVTSIRTIRGEMKIAPATAVDLFVIGSAPLATLIQTEEALLKALVRIKTISYVDGAPSHVSLGSRAPIEEIELLIPLPQEMRQQEALRVTKAIEKIRTTIEKAEAQIQKMSLSDRTPSEVLEKMRGGLEQQRRELASLTQQLELLHLS